MHHDSHEAFVCDLPTPLKRLIDEQGPGVYARTSRRLDEAIAEALGFELPPEGLRGGGYPQRGRPPRAGGGGQAGVHNEGSEMLRHAGLTEKERSEPRLEDRLLSPGEAKERFLDAHDRASEAAGKSRPR